MGKLVQGFSPHSQEGVFTAEISFRQGHNEFGHEWGHSIADQKKIFLEEAESVCDQMAIFIGYNETVTGFEIGFEQVSDHAPFMARIEERMSERCARGQLTPETLRLLEAELVSSGVWTEDERDENVRKMTTPADPPSQG